MRRDPLCVAVVFDNVAVPWSFFFPLSPVFCTIIFCLVDFSMTTRNVLQMLGYSGSEAVRSAFVMVNG